MCDVFSLAMSFRDERDEVREENKELARFLMELQSTYRTTQADKEIWRKAVNMLDEDKCSLLRENEIMRKELESWRMHLHPEIKSLQESCAAEFLRTRRYEKEADKEYKEAIKANKEANEWATQCGKVEKQIRVLSEDVKMWKSAFITKRQIVKDLQEEIKKLKEQLDTKGIHKEVLLNRLSEERASRIIKLGYFFAQERNEDRIKCFPWDWFVEECMNAIAPGAMDTFYNRESIIKRESIK